MLPNIWRQRDRPQEAVRRNEREETMSGSKMTLFRGLTALFVWLLVVTIFGSKIANNYASSINSALGITTTRIVEK